MKTSKASLNDYKAKCLTLITPLCHRLNLCNLFAKPIICFSVMTMLIFHCEGLLQMHSWKKNMQTLQTRLLSVLFFPFS